MHLTPPPTGWAFVRMYLRPAYVAGRECTGAAPLPGSISPTRWIRARSLVVRGVCTDRCCKSQCAYCTQTVRDALFVFSFFFFDFSIVFGFRKYRNQSRSCDAKTPLLYLYHALRDGRSDVDRGGRHLHGAALRVFDALAERRDR